MDVRTMMNDILKDYIKNTDTKRIFENEKGGKKQCISK